MRTYTVLDIETVPCEHGPARSPDRVKVPGSIKKPESIEAYRNSPENQEKEFRARSKTPLLGRVASISWSTWSLEEDGLTPSQSWLEVRTAMYAKESETLEAFWEFLPDDTTLVAHYGRKFDFRFVGWRAARAGMHDLARIMTPPTRFSTKRHLDTSDFWGHDYVSLKAVCESLGIAPPYGSGAEVYDAWLRKDWSYIQAHGEEDVRALNMVFLTMLRGGLIGGEW